MNYCYEKRIQNQFGSFCVKVLKNEAKMIQRKNIQLRNLEKQLSELAASEGNLTAACDNYFMKDHIFTVLGLPVVVTGDLLAKAIAQLSKEKRDVILLSYFVGMSDREISERLNVVRQTISKRRAATLKEMHKYLTEEGIDW